MRRLRPGRARTGLLLALGAALGVLAAPARARADPCGRPDLLDSVPSEGATGVPLDAALQAHYAPSADYLGEEVTLEVEGGRAEVIPATFDATQGLLTIRGPERVFDPLLPDTVYLVRWPTLRGLNVAAPGLGAVVKFTTGSAADVGGPQFAGATGLRWDLERKRNDCTDDLEDRFVFDLDLAEASDDGGRDGLWLIVFQTAGSAAPDQSTPVLTRALPPPGERARVALPPGAAVGRVCFAALARDLTGKISDSGNKEVCVQTTEPPFFRGCSVAPGATGAPGRVPGSGAMLIALAMVAVRSRTGARRRGRRAAANAVRGE